MSQWNRRQFLSGLLTAVGAEVISVTEAHARSLGAAVTPQPSLVPHERATSAESRSGPHPSGSDQALHEVLPEGTRFGRWRVVAVHPVKYGAVPVVIETRTGERFQVDVLARDRRQGARRGISQTRSYALYLSNTGRGAKPTSEEHGLGVIWLAALLRARELRVSSAPLLTLRERLMHFPAGRFDAFQGRDPANSAAPWGQESAPMSPLSRENA